MADMMMGMPGSETRHTRSLGKTNPANPYAQAINYLNQPEKQQATASTPPPIDSAVYSGDGINTSVVSNQSAGGSANYLQGQNMASVGSTTAPSQPGVNMYQPMYNEDNTYSLSKDFGITAQKSAPQIPEWAKAALHASRQGMNVKVN